MRQTSDHKCPSCGAEIGQVCMEVREGKLQPSPVYHYLRVLQAIEPTKKELEELNTKKK
jgi:hypothetical protein